MILASPDDLTTAQSLGAAAPASRSGSSANGRAFRSMGQHPPAARVAGLVGGILSSTAVTIDFAHQSRHEPALHQPLAVSVTAACTVLLMRAVVASLALHYPVGIALAPYVIAPLLAGVALVGPALRRPTGGDAGSPPELPNPLGLKSAIPMAVGLQVVLSAVRSGWRSGHARRAGHRCRYRR